MLVMPFSFRFGLLALFAIGSLATRISFFSDGQCQEFQYDVRGPNGYPDGDCSLLESKGNFSSFKIVRLDRGCDVTLYGPSKSEGICSPGGSLVADPGRCYSNTKNGTNTAWTYYSIDTCIRDVADSPETTLSISSTTSSASPTSSSTPALSTSAADATQPSESANATTVATGETNTGAIAGGVVGGIAGLALIVGGLWFFLHRRRKQQREGPVQLNEMSGEPLVEMSGKEVPKPSELPEGRPEAFVEPPPQELSAEAERGIRGEKPPS